MAVSYVPFTSTALNPAAVDTEAYAGDAELWSLEAPKDSSTSVPSTFASMSSSAGAGGGASALRTSLNLSTAVPTVVLFVKSV